MVRLDQIGHLRSEFKRLRGKTTDLAEDAIPKAVRAGVSVDEIAARTGLSRNAISKLIDGGAAERRSRPHTAKERDGRDRAGRKDRKAVKLAAGSDLGAGAA